MSKRPRLDPNAYQVLDWPSLQHMAETGGCQCCGEKFSLEMPMEVASKCHKGSPVWVAYWDGTLFIKCAVCEEPICKIEVSRSLLSGKA